MASRMITLESEDGKLLDVDLDAAKMSQLLCTVIEACDPSEKIPVPIVKAHVLEKVIEYMNQYKGRTVPEIRKPLPIGSFSDLVGEWDFKFVAVEQTLIFEMILAANYLDIPGLLDLCCAKVASEIRNKSVEEIRKIFGILNDFTPEEEAQIREENRWCELD